MKKIILSIIIVSFIFVKVKAQCSITSSCNTGTVGFCSFPSPYSNLSNATEGVLYNENIQMSVGSVVSGYTISNVQITSITGLPSGVSYTTNPVGGVFLANSDACVLLSGIPALGAVGNYTISANLVVMTNAGPFPSSVNWQLVVNPQYSGCVIAPTCSISFAGYCTTPNENTYLQNANELSAYSSDIQISLGTMISNIYPINNATLTAISGFPSGLSYSVNPSIVINGGSNACINIQGIPTIGSSGNYTLTASVLIASGTTTLNAPPIIWYLTVNPSSTTNVKSINKTVDIYIFPNPATSELIITSLSYIGKIQIVDALGKVVFSDNANYAAQTKIDISNLAKGVYFIQINDGSKVSTRKFIKE